MTLRKTPIKRSTKPIRREGPSTLRWKSWRRQQKAIAVARADGNCEFHTWAEVEQYGPIDWHHVFGRDDEPWSSFHPFTLMVCRTAHDLTHTKVVVRRQMQIIALKRFLITPPFNGAWIHEDFLREYPLEAYDYLIRELKNQGVLPNVASSAALTQKFTIIGRTSESL